MYIDSKLTYSKLSIWVPFTNISHQLSKIEYTTKEDDMTWVVSTNRSTPSDPNKITPSLQSKQGQIIIYVIQKIT